MTVSQHLVNQADLKGYFGAAYPKVSQFGELLVTLGIERGLIGPREADRIWERHLVNCAGVCSVLPPEGTILDLGSGAGLPGLVIAIMRPEQPITLLESLQRRTNWLTEMASTLDLPNVTVVRGRAGENLKLPSVDAVTARAVAPLAKLLTWSAPLLKPGGALYALKGENLAEEIAELSKELPGKRFTANWNPVQVLEAETLPGVQPIVIAKAVRK